MTMTNPNRNRVLIEIVKPDGTRMYMWPWELGDRVPRMLYLSDGSLQVDNLMFPVPPPFEFRFTVAE